MAILRSSNFKEMSEDNVYSDAEILEAVSNKEDIARKSRSFKRKQALLDNIRNIIDAELRALFVEVSYNAIRKYLDAGQNLYLRAMKEISLVYQREPERTLEDGDVRQQARLDEIVQEQHLDLVLSRANFLLNGLNDLVASPMVIGKSISMALYTPDQVTIMGNRMDPSIPEALVFEEKYADKNNTVQSMYTFWSPIRHFKLIPDAANIGKFIKVSLNAKDQNPYAEVNKLEGQFFPFVFMHSSYRDFSFWDEHTNTSLFEATVLIALQNTFKNFMVPQQFKQLAVKAVSKSDGAWINDQVSNPLHIFQTNGDITVLDWQSAIDKLDLVIQNKVAQAANDYGISAEQIKLQTSAQSGFSRLVAKERIYELRDEQIKFWRIYEKDIYDANRAANNLYLTTDFLTQSPNKVELPADVTFTVDFAEPKMLVDPMEDLNVKEKKINMGLISPVDLIMAENPDIDSREKALELYKQNIEERSAVESLGGFRTPSLKDLSGDKTEVKAVPSGAKE
jgi:hypothetical protein